ncbi:bifunctional biotin--[acetyl-CoA-carboxylase] ligase/biotin operon repressor BirA [Solemya pervernicosa gill symbiont]|nr:bifunctional biotin--[acetyl-CoA-carboxylase] ligase/biotin operon repressor BirA [Solemya pervernicosa gill symbiont]
MSMHHNLLQLLSNGRFHSGEELGRELGVSRAAVWKSIKLLQKMGMTIFAIRGRGYSLEHSVELLESHKICSEYMTNKDRNLEQLLVLESVPSTNSYLMERIDNDWVKPRAVVAEYQSEGRGRRGRNWCSPFAASIYLSLFYSFDRGVADLGGISLAIGLAVRKAILSLMPCELSVKWPNDLMWKGKKLGGVLVELSGDPLSECKMVVGVGINYRMPNGTNIDQPWIDLSSIVGDNLPSRNELTGALIESILDACSVLDNSGFEQFIEEWSLADAVVNQKVSLQLGNKRIDGIARGIDSLGSIRIESDGVVRSYASGEVSLRVTE